MRLFKCAGCPRDGAPQTTANILTYLVAKIKSHQQHAGFNNSNPNYKNMGICDQFGWTVSFTSSS